MEESPSRVPRKDRDPRAGPAKKSHRCPAEDDGGGGDPIKCSGRSCRSCTAVVIADCVAVCCCPCAVVNILALAFLKLPWTVGRRCLGLGRKKGRRLERGRRCEGELEGDKDGISGKGGVEEGTPEVVGLGDEGQRECYSARFEAEKVWLELYQVGHLGFGRVSFTGIQPHGRGN
ncbi:hypothetical protein RJ640_027946 [Escallonia rubra]|uniref:Uncharacterized protein n=1 Tax=Escallonia rubra TaxID=112253 RepID=A0AA88U6Y8_9ASTE|nr:hypothetical protein RJ640_027946 [Escallonia rubra]